MDDEPVCCVSICKALAVDYPCVEFAASAKSALAILENNDFEVLISDFGLPGMQGYKLVAAAKTLRPNLLIALIAADAKSLKPTRFEGVEYVDSKPFEMEMLRLTVARLLSSRHTLPLTE